MTNHDKEVGDEVHRKEVHAYRAIVASVVSALVISVAGTFVTSRINDAVFQEELASMKTYAADNRIHINEISDKLQTFRDEQVRNTTRIESLTNRMNDLDVHQRDMERRYGKDWWKQK